MVEGFRFLVVNAVGLAVDLSIAVFLRGIGINIFFAAVAGFTVATMLNYRLHARWTFQGAGTSPGHGLAPRGRFAGFYLVALSTIGVRLVVLKALLAVGFPTLFGTESELLFVATAASIVVNYTLCKTVIFRVPWKTPL